MTHTKADLIYIILNLLLLCLCAFEKDHLGKIIPSEQALLQQVPRPKGCFLKIYRQNIKKKKKTHLSVMSVVCIVLYRWCVLHLREQTQGLNSVKAGTCTLQCVHSAEQLEIILMSCHVVYIEMKWNDSGIDKLSILHWIKSDTAARGIETTWNWFKMRMWISFRHGRHFWLSQWKQQCSPVKLSRVSSVLTKRYHCVWSRVQQVTCFGNSAA